MNSNLIDVLVNFPESVTEGTLISWHKQIGNFVSKDELLVDVETDKVVLEVIAPQSGFLVEMKYPSGATLANGDLIARIDTTSLNKKERSENYSHNLFNKKELYNKSIRNKFMDIREILKTPGYGPLVNGLISEFLANLASIHIWKLEDKSTKKWYPLYWQTKPCQKSAHCLLWFGTNKTADNLAQAKEMVKQFNDHKLAWRLPKYDELVAYSKTPYNPQREGDAFCLFGKIHFFSNVSRVDLRQGYTNPNITDGSGNIIAVVDRNFFLINDLQWLISENSALYPANMTKTADILQPFIDKLTNLQTLTGLDISLGGIFKRLHKRSNCPNNLKLNATLPELLADLDYIPVREPKIESAEWSDPNKGLWELWGGDKDVLKQLGLRARNPVLDIQEGHVAIDFGTSSTVVAYDDLGIKKLLRIGVRDYYQKVEQSHFENPTVIEFVDFPEMLSAWQDCAYRPAMNWNNVRCSHEALHKFRNNETDPKIVGSILHKLKQWALREAADYRVQITDQNNAQEHILAPLTLRSPVKGQPLIVNNTDPFDPIELYAWFLGMIINGRKLGIHLRYNMTFPVAYPREVKDKILASFKRGLQRSLPASLVSQPEFERFSVEERASEPTAYAACAMAALDIQATSEGVAYAVFDFGGGTTDFDFGYYRLPNPQEEDEGYEVVFEHFAPAGDKFLGGENLLENMAYLVFRKNIDQCAKKRIVFTRPLDAKDFPGSEPFLERTQAASTNTLMMIAKLRPILEAGQYVNSSGVEKLNLLNCEGKMESCEFKIPVDDLEVYLQDRIGQGVASFLAALRKAFADNVPKEVHVLLAGNASRSRLVQGYFNLLSNDDSNAKELNDFTLGKLEQMFGDRNPNLIPHAPLQADSENPHKPTAKTGVALGLLDLCKGSVIKVVDHATNGSSSGEAPFAYYVGRFRQGRFQAGLNQGAPYKQWFELGPQRENRFEMGFTSSPRAHTGQMEKGEPGLKTKWLDWVGQIHGHKVYARATAPDAIELCTAVSMEDISTGKLENLISIKL